MNNFQMSMRDRIFQLRKSHSLADVIKIAKKSLIINSKDYTAEFKTQFNGEICEAILELLIKEWMEKNKVNGALIRSLILRDLNSNNKDFLTEIDMVLFTPWCVYCIECKSYAGDKEIVGDGTICVANGRNFDVFKQNQMHLDVLRGWVDGFSKTPVYQMVLFNFATGEMKDKRDAKARCLMPSTTEQNVLKLFSEVTKTVWDIKGIKQAIPKLEKFSDEHRAKHLEYVKSLHGKDE